MAHLICLPQPVSCLRIIGFRSCLPCDVNAPIGGAGCGRSAGRDGQHPPRRGAVHRGGSAYTSQRCPRCDHTERANRPTWDNFSCRRCGLAGRADHVAGVNIAQRGATAWVFVNMPAPVPA
ncbi:transposase [Streptomyces sp. RB6PN25]|uniref:Transposase n=2 Tax=Streptomyces humicola TaxID=2953240 RepID=A0ABT1PTQ6_9ACTN|nr:transposase [Streptomyces humicola]